MRKYLDLNLTGKTAVVTGASSGIGRAISEAMAEAGANLVLVGRDAARLQETVDAVRARGVEAEPVVVELTDDAAPAAIVDAAVKRFGGLNILINCAGIFEPMPFEESCLVPEAEFTHDCAPNRFYAYGVVARLALVAAARELEEMAAELDAGEQAIRKLA